MGTKINYLDWVRHVKQKDYEGQVLTTYFEENEQYLDVRVVGEDGRERVYYHTLAKNWVFVRSDESLVVETTGNLFEEDLLFKPFA